MKNLLLCLFAIFFSQNDISALSIGRVGDAFFEEDTCWQRVVYKNDDAGFEAAIPGSPKSGLSNDTVYTYSKYQNVDYEIHCSLTERYTAPKSEANFIRQVEEAFGNDAEVTAIATNQKTVKYIAEMYFINESKIIRIYCGKNRLYWAIVEGEDLTLAPLFFESIDITK